MSELISGRYRVQGFIGKGGAAKVYRAYDTILNRWVALKVMPIDKNDRPTLLRNYREAESVSKIQHDNVIKIYDLGEDGNNFYIAMELVRGPDLKQMIQRHGPFEVEEAVYIVRQICAGLQAAHANGIIHRDIKPQNILVKDNLQCLITDFGIAVMEDSVSLTGDKSFFGSAHYLCPEASIKAVPNAKFDIYSVGIVFYELLAGVTPYDGNNHESIALKHYTDPFPSIRKINNEIPVAVENIIARCTAKDPRERYDSIDQVLSDLDECLLPKHAADKPLRLKTITVSPETGEYQSAPALPAKKKHTFWHSAFLILFGAAVAAVCFCGLLLFTDLDLLSFMGMKHFPQIEGLSLSEAREVLQSDGFESEPVISYELDERMPAETIIHSSLQSGQLANVSAPIDLTVSKGPGFMIEDYTGKTLPQIQQLFAEQGIEMKFNLLYEGKKNTEPGIILKQEQLLAGEVIDPSVPNEITFVLSTYPSITIPEEIIGMEVEEAKSLLNEQGIAVMVKNYYGSDTVIAVEPEVGSSYTQEGSDSVVTLYN